MLYMHRKSHKSSNDKHSRDSKDLQKLEALRSDSLLADADITTGYGIGYSEIHELDHDLINELQTVSDMGENKIQTLETLAAKNPALREKIEQIKKNVNEAMEKAEADRELVGI